MRPNRKPCEISTWGRNRRVSTPRLRQYQWSRVFTIGPAGAPWHHDVPGNVDHIMWVTMTEDGPQMGNIALKGLFDRKDLDPKLFGAYDRKGAGKADAKGEEKK